jgi:hypothetical protein
MSKPATPAFSANIGVISTKPAVAKAASSSTPQKRAREEIKSECEDDGEDEDEEDDEDDEDEYDEEEEEDEDVDVDESEEEDNSETSGDDLEVDNVHKEIIQGGNISEERLRTDEGLQKMMEKVLQKKDRLTDEQVAVIEAEILAKRKARREQPGNVDFLARLEEKYTSKPRPGKFQGVYGAGEEFSDTDEDDDDFQPDEDEGEEEEDEDVDMEDDEPESKKKPAKKKPAETAAAKKNPTQTPKKPAAKKAPVKK